MEKRLYRGLLALDILILIWIILFKLKFNIFSIFDDRHRSLNLIPFAAPSITNDGGIGYGEMILNCIFFIPLGLLLNVNFKKIEFLPKFAFIVIFSLTAELLQFIFAIGATDITDVITNAVGGFVGLTLYDLSNKFINAEKLDRIIFSVGILLLVLFLSIHVSHFFFR